MHRQQHNSSYSALSKSPEQQQQRFSHQNRSWSVASDNSSTVSGLPLPANAKTCMSAATKRWRYLRRLFHFRQMDFDFAFWQIVYLISDPKRVYKDFAYRKQTKRQFARDDPAFLVLLSGFLVLSTALVSVVIYTSFSQYILLLLYVIMADVIGAGMLVATALWFITNKFMIKPTLKGTEDVEWGFCFDVHLNAFFPVLFILHVILPGLFFLPGFLGTFVMNSLWLVALIYYIYISFLGYNSLGILKDTRLFFLPLVPIVIFILTTICLNINLCWVLLDFYIRRI